MLHHEGSRQVLLTSYVHLARHVEASMEVPATPKDVYEWLKKASPEEVKIFLSAASENEMFYATVGKHDLLYVPCAFVFYEKAGSASDVFGLRVQSFGAGQLESMEKAKRALVAARKPNTVLEAAIDCINAD